MTRPLVASALISLAGICWLYLLHDPFGPFFWAAFAASSGNES